MLQLNFKTFIERFKILKESKKTAVLHYSEESSKFILYFKNHEYWEYYSVVKKSEIIEFGRTMYNATPEESISDFKINYLTHAVPVITEEIQEEPVMDETTPDMSEPVPEISKTTDPEIIEEAKDYEEFFIKIIDEWEKKVLTALNKLDIEKKFDSGINKTFGEFVRDLFNGVHTRKFLLRLRQVIKRSMNQGMEVAEEQMGVNVGWSDIFQDKLKSLEHQQLNGYTINGKKWHGIRGTSQELRLKILESMQEDLQNKSGLEAMTEHIKDIFQGSTTYQAKRIARTETNRFVNESKLTSYTESGIEGRKAWSIVPSKCCDECTELHNKYFKKGIPFDAQFVTDKGRRLDSPPAHPNCRCVLEYRTITK